MENNIDPTVEQISIYRKYCIYIDPNLNITCHLQIILELCRLNNLKLKFQLIENMVKKLWSLWNDGDNINRQLIIDMRYLLLSYCIFKADHIDSILGYILMMNYNIFSDDIGDLENLPDNFYPKFGLSVTVINCMLHYKKDSRAWDNIRCSIKKFGTLTPEINSNIWLSFPRPHPIYLNFLLE